MYKSQMLGLLLATTLLIGSSAISMQVFADKPYKSKYSEQMYDSYSEESYGMQYDQQPYYPSYEHDKEYNYDNTYNKHSNQYQKYVCEFGLFKGFVVKDPYACFVKLPECQQCPTGDLGTPDETENPVNDTEQTEEPEMVQVQPNIIQPMQEDSVQQQKESTQMNSANSQLEQLQKLEQLKAQKLSEKLK